jgi:hypothetical protein
MKLAPSRRGALVFPALGRLRPELLAAIGDEIRARRRPL